MGGALIILALVTATLLWCDLRSTLVWLALLVTVGYGAIGFLDDYLKISRKNKKGLPGKLKLLGQFVIGGVAVVWLFTSNALPPEVRLRLAPPLLNFDKFPIVLPIGLYATNGDFDASGELSEAMTGRITPAVEQFAAWHIGTVRARSPAGPMDTVRVRSTQYES